MATKKKINRYSTRGIKPRTFRLVSEQSVTRKEADLYFDLMVADGYTKVDILDIATDTIIKTNNNKLIK